MPFCPVLQAILPFEFWGVVKFQIYNDTLSGSINLHTSSLYIFTSTVKVTKDLMTIWVRYSSSKTCQNESNTKSCDAQSHEKDSNKAKNDCNVAADNITVILGL